MANIFTLILTATETPIFTASQYQAWIASDSPTLLGQADRPSRQNLYTAKTFLNRD